MLRTSTRARYALRAMIELARHEGRGPILLREVADAQRISTKYLEQLTIPLRRAGLLLAQRGPQGGYALARPAERITTRDIVEAVEGPVRVLDCLRSAHACDRTRTCAARGLWGRINRAITEVLTETTLADLLESQRQAEAQQISCYEI